MFDNRIYALDTRLLHEKNAYRDIRSTLTEERQTKADRFIFEKDRLLSAAAGILLDKALSDYSVVDRRIAYGEHGKPYLAADCGVHFNLSHSEHLAVCAVSNRRVGIDTEQIRTFEDDLAAFVYHESEIEQVKRLSGTEPPDRLFTTLWTVKESVMKYFGTGLSLAPKELTVTFGDIVTAQCARYDTTSLGFTTFEENGYMITVCSEYAPFSSGIQYVEKG